MVGVAFLLFGDLRALSVVFLHEGVRWNLPCPPPACQHTPVGYLLPIVYNDTDIISHNMNYRRFLCSIFNK